MNWRFIVAIFMLGGELLLGFYMPIVARADSAFEDKIKNRIVAVLSPTGSLLTPFKISTGILLTSNGYVLIAKHALAQNNPGLQVRLMGEDKNRNASVTRTDEFFDLALLHIDDYNDGLASLSKRDFSSFGDLTDPPKILVYGNPTSDQGTRFGDVTTLSIKNFSAGKAFLNGSLAPGYSGGPVLANGGIAGIALISAGGAQEVHILPVKFARSVMRTTGIDPDPEGATDYDVEVTRLEKQVVELEKQLDDHKRLISEMYSRLDWEAEIDFDNSNRNQTKRILRLSFNKRSSTQYDINTLGIELMPVFLKRLGQDGLPIKVSPEAQQFDSPKSPIEIRDFFDRYIENVRVLNLKNSDWFRKTGQPVLTLDQVSYYKLTVNMRMQGMDDLITFVMNVNN
jgi:hypothetical protein